MGLLDKLVQKTNLDLEVISESGSTYLYLSELEKIQRLVQMDLMDESKLIQIFSDRYGLSLLSTSSKEVQNYENPALTKQIFKRTGILPVYLGTKHVGLLSVNSNQLNMNMASFHLDQQVNWYLAQQQQIEAILESSKLPSTETEISATGRIYQVFEEAILRRGQDIHLEQEKTNSELDSGLTVISRMFLQSQ